MPMRHSIPGPTNSVTFPDRMGGLARCPLGRVVEAMVASLDRTSGYSAGGAVIYGYFDDSGTDAASPVAVMAGYVATDRMWRRFERDSKRLFDREHIDFFRAKLFDH